MAILYNRLDMTDTAKKIISEFCLTDDGKQQLQAFFDARFGDLRSGDATTSGKAMQDLALLIRGEPEGTGVFPKEAMEELRRIFSNQSELALVIRNCPECDLRNSKKPSPNQSYSHHIACALGELFGAEKRHASLPLHRSTHLSNPGNVVGNGIHRDLQSRRNRHLERSRDAAKEYVDCLLFSSPVNDEHALTQILHLGRAIESVPEDIRKSTMVNVIYLEGLAQGDLTRHPVTLEHLQQQIRAASYKGAALQNIPACVFSHQNIPGLSEAIRQNSYNIDLQPGTVMVFSERHIFHHAHRGDESYIAQIPPGQDISRFLIHHSVGFPQK